MLFSKKKYYIFKIYFIDRKKHAIPLFVKAKCLPITILYYEAVCKLVLYVYKDSAPSNIMKLFTRRPSIHTYTTCLSQSQLFSVKYSRLKMQRKAFSGVSVKIWNEIPNEYKICWRNPSKKETKRLLLNIFKTEYSNLETDEMMLKFKWSKFKTNWTSSTIFFVHLEILGLFSFMMNVFYFPFFLSLCILKCFCVFYFFTSVLFAV